MKKIKKRGPVLINVAPLVDVMLVLMVIFMMTSQISTVGVNVNLPKTQGKVKTDSSTDNIVISVTKEGKIYIAEAQLTLDELIQKLPIVLKQNKTDVVYIKGDKDIQYGLLIKIMGVIAHTGICKVSLIAEAIK